MEKWVVDAKGNVTLVKDDELTNIGDKMWSTYIGPSKKQLQEEKDNLIKQEKVDGTKSG